MVVKGENILRLSLILFIFAATSLFAQDPQVHAEIDNQTPELGEVLQFDVVVEGKISGRVTPEILGGDEFELSYLGTQSSVNIINGNTTQETRFSYELRPRKPGLLSTPIAELSIEGKLYRTRPIQVNVRKGSDSQNAQLSDDIIFLRQSSSRKKVFVGEQIPLSLNLFHAVDLLEANFLDLRFDHFWVESLGKERVTRKRLQNRDYTVHEIRKALFPLSPGSITVEPKSIEVKYQDPRSRRGPDIFGFGSGLFDGVFGARAKKQTFRSNALEFEVMPLPEPPADFPTLAGSQILVGLSSLSLKVETTEMQLGESRTLTLVIESEGNLSPLQELQLEIDGARVYEESPETESEMRQGKLVSKKIFRYSLVPTRAGKLQVPEIRLGFFDPESGSFEVISSEPRQIFVSGNDEHVHLQDSVSRETLNSGVENTSQSLEPAVPGYREQSSLERLSAQISPGLALLLIFVTLTLCAFLTVLTLWLRHKALRVRLRRALAEAQSEQELRRSFEDFLCRLVLKAHSQSPRGLLQKDSLDSDRRQNFELIYEQLDLLLYSQISADERKSGMQRVRNNILELFDQCA